MKQLHNKIAIFSSDSGNLVKNLRTRSLHPLCLGMGSKKKTANYPLFVDKGGGGSPKVDKRGGGGGDGGE